jgi:osmotically-inducible protein OsmY
MKKKWLVLVLAGLLQGCITGSNGLGLEGRSVETIQNDDQITQIATNMIATDQALTNKAHIVAVSYNYVLLLAGEAPTEELRQQAVELVKKVPNIKRIFNQIIVAQPISLLTRSKDTSITANIRARMLATTNLKSNNFKVVTDDGTVYILGLATRQQGDIAAKVVQDSSGVKRVVKLIEYLPDDAKTGA